MLASLARGRVCFAPVADRVKGVVQVVHPADGWQAVPAAGLRGLGAQHEPSSRTGAQAPALARIHLSERQEQPQGGTCTCLALRHSNAPTAVSILSISIGKKDNIPLRERGN